MNQQQNPQASGPLMKVLGVLAVLGATAAVVAWQVSKLGGEARTRVVSDRGVRSGPTDDESVGVLVTEDTCREWGAKTAAFVLREMSYAEAGAPAEVGYAAAAKQREAMTRNKCMAETRGKRIPPRVTKCFADADTLMKYSTCVGLAGISAK